MCGWAGLPDLSTSCVLGPSRGPEMSLASLGVGPPRKPRWAPRPDSLNTEAGFLPDLSMWSDTHMAESLGTRPGLVQVLPPVHTSSL